MNGILFNEEPHRKRKIMIFSNLLVLHSVVAPYASFLDAGNPDVFLSWLVPKRELDEAKFFPQIRVEGSLPSLCVVNLNQQTVMQPLKITPLFSFCIQLWHLNVILHISSLWRNLFSMIEPGNLGL